MDAMGDDAVLDGVGVRGFFAAPWRAPTLGTLRTALQAPEFTAPEATLAAAIKGTSVLTFISNDYTVVEIEPRELGWLTLVLRAVS